MRSTVLIVAAVLLAAGGVCYSLLVVANDLRHVSDEIEVVARNVNAMGDDVRSIADDVNAIADALAGEDDDNEQQQQSTAAVESRPLAGVRIAHARRGAGVLRARRATRARHRLVAR